MDASPSAPTLAAGWPDMSGSRPHFTTTFDIKPSAIDAPRYQTFDIKPSAIDAPRSLLNVGLAPSPTLIPQPHLGDYFTNHGHRMILGTSFVQPPMMGILSTDPNYFMREFVPRNEEFVSLFEQSRQPRRGEEDLAGSESSPGTSLSTPTVLDGGRLHNSNADGRSTASLPQYAARLLPILTADKSKSIVVAGNEEVKVDDEKGKGGNGANSDEEDEDEDGEEDNDGGNDDNDEEGNAWQCQTSSTGPALQHDKKVMVLRQEAVSRGASPIACQDCGNQAKRDCLHMRCRTCCKSRGLACETHVKSTWVPAFKRRQRQQLFANSCGGAPQPIKILRSKPSRTKLEQGAASDPGHGANSLTSTSTGTPPPASSDPNWLQQEGRLKRTLPAEARENAIFKCVKVTGLNDGHEEFAYQTVVKIGGHIYKGILYDQGVDDKVHRSSSNIADLRLGGGGTSVAPSSLATIDLTGNLYGPSESVLGSIQTTH